MHDNQVPIRGVIADVVVPYSSDEGVDWDSLKHELRFLNQCSPQGLSIGGVLGGALGATSDELSSLCEEVKRSSEVPLFAILFPDAAPEALEMLRAVRDAGADVIAVAQPHYLSQPGIDGLAELFADLRRHTDRPLMIADCLPGSALGVRPIQELVHRNLIDGIFESADMHVLVDLLCLDLGLPIYSGVEDLHYLAFILGADGVISNLATVCPTESLHLLAAVQKGDYIEARKTHERLVRVWRSLNWGVQAEARIRSALTAQGRPIGSARSPYHKLPLDAAGQVRTALRENEIVGLQQR